MFYFINPINKYFQKNDRLKSNIIHLNCCQDRGARRPVIQFNLFKMDWIYSFIYINIILLNVFLARLKNKPTYPKLSFRCVLHQTTQTAHKLYLDRLSSPIVSWHAKLRFHVMFFDWHLTATCCIQGLSFTTFKEILQF